MSGINMKNSPNWFNIMKDTTDFVISDMKLWNEETNEEAPPKVCWFRSSPAFSLSLCARGSRIEVEIS